jgi:hypothetical protein
MTGVELSSTRTVVQRDPRVLERQIGSLLLLLPPGTEEPVMVDGAAAVVWTVCGSPQSLKDMQNHFSSEIRSDEDDDIASVVSEVVSQLMGHGLLVAG